MILPIGATQNSLWQIPVYAKFLAQVDPYQDHSLFRSLHQAYLGNKTYWRTPSPEPDISSTFWDKLPATFADEEIQCAAQSLAASLFAADMQPHQIVFAAILRAGVPIADWLCRLLPGAQAAALSLFTGLGIDRLALDALQASHPNREIIFVDGWTGRGGVAAELRKEVPHRLAVLIDPWNIADFSGTNEDILCPSACFTGPTTLGFSRTFLIDETQMFGAYKFPQKYCRWDVVRAWQKSCPPIPSTIQLRVKRERFYAGTTLRVHSNEVCRALINAAPIAIYFADKESRVSADFDLLLQLAEQRKVPVFFSQTNLHTLRSRVACSLSTTNKECSQ